MNCKSKHKNLTGLKVGRLTVIRLNCINKHRQTVWECICDCGNKTNVRGYHLLQNRVNSCGCLRNDVLAEMLRTHGMTDTSPYRSWSGMLSRCENTNDERYKDYGGRGIAVCDEWHDFEMFWGDMKKGYAEGLTLDRIDVNGNYCPENCKWSTQKEQANNRRNNVIISFNGITQTLSQWADMLGINYYTLSKRFNRGWSVERALTTEVNI